MTVATGPLPRRATRPRTAAWTPRRALLATLLGLVASLAAAAAAELGFAGDRAAAAAAAAGLAVGPLVLLAVVVLFARTGAEDVGAATLGVRRTPFWAAAGWGAAVLVLAWAVNGLLTVVAGAPAEEGGGPSQPGLVLALLLAAGLAVTTPIAEEVAFRGYLFPALTRRLGPWTAALVTSVLFGAAHVLALPPIFLLGAAAFGFGACLLRWFTGSLLPCVAVHSLNNAIVLAVLTGGRLWPAIVLAPITSVVVLLPFAAAHRPQGAPS